MSEEELQREIVSGAFSMQVADCERNIRIQFEKLQQENQKLKIEISARETVCDELQNRINKAVEYIEKHKQVYDIDGSVEPKLDDFDILASPKYLISLLKGDKE